MEVAVLGATGDGQRIAADCALAGHAIRLHDADANVVMDSIDAIERGYGDDVIDAIDGTTGLEAAVNDADVVVDATDGDEETRRELVADLEEFASDDSLVLISGVAVSVTAVTVGLRTPGRAVGLHFVEPGESSVVEVVVAEQTTEPVRERAVEFVEGIGGTPLVVRDRPGYASTRLDMALIAEAIRMVEDGVASVPDVDRAVELGRDHPTGPLALADEMGLGNVLDALEDLANRLDGRFDPPGLLREKVSEGSLGVTTGDGFYEWENGARAGPEEPNPEVHGRPAPERDAGGQAGPGNVPGANDR